MKKMSISARVEEIITPLASRENLEVVDVEYKKEGSNWILRVFIDKTDGITHEDCEKVSSFISAELEKVDAIANRYFIEVSSPGVERPLKKPKDFIRFSGSTVKIRTVDKIEGSRNFQGVIVGYMDDQVVLKLEDGNQIEIPYQLIGQAKLKVF